MKYLYFALLLSICSCTIPNIDYLGNDYEPTENVDVYFFPNDIEEYFTIIGQMNANNENDESFSLDDMKDSMMCESKEKGANAILFLDFESFADLHYITTDLLVYEY